MIIQTLAYQREDTFENNIVKLKTLIMTNIIEEDRNLFFLGEMIFDEYLLTQKNIDENKYSQKSEKMMQLKSICKDNGVYLSLGYIEESETGNYNSQIVIDFNGNIVHNHRKNNLTTLEQKVFHKGEYPVSSFNIDELHFSLSICYDMFSPLFKGLFDKKTNIFLHSLTDPQDGVFTLGFSGRFTPSYYLAANRFFKNEKSYYNGHIGIYNSLGKKIEFSMHKEEILNIKFDQHTSYRTNKIITFIKIAAHVLRHLYKTLDYLNWNRKNRKKR